MLQTACEIPLEIDVVYTPCSCCSDASARGARRHVVAYGWSPQRDFFWRAVGHARCFGRSSQIVYDILFSHMRGHRIACTVCYVSANCCFLGIGGGIFFVLCAPDLLWLLIVWLRLNDRVHACKVAFLNPSSSLMVLSSMLIFFLLVNPLLPLKIFRILVGRLLWMRSMMLL
jgi:hypothetical protein